MNSRILVLDSFRGLAAVSVMLFHFTFLYNSIYNNLSIDFTFKYGFYGVQLFFMISGFVIFMSLNKVTSIKDFFYKRFIRLYPTYWICLIMTTLFIVLFPLHLYSVTLKQFLGNLTMVQGLLKIDNIDGSYWSLLPELMFYLMMTIIIKFKLHNKIIKCSLYEDNLL
jgi:peptidoglycan/LPS O-acetylase OafA/YrhL